MSWIAIGSNREVVLHFEPSGVSPSDFIECFESQHFKSPSSKSAVSESKERAIRDAFDIRDLQPIRVSDFRKSPFNGKTRGATPAPTGKSAISTYLGFKSISVDSQAPDFCVEGGIGDA